MQVWVCKTMQNGPLCPISKGVRTISSAPSLKVQAYMDHWITVAALFCLDLQVIGCFCSQQTSTFCDGVPNKLIAVFKAKSVFSADIAVLAHASEIIWNCPKISKLFLSFSFFSAPMGSCGWDSIGHAFKRTLPGHERISERSGK